MKWSSECHGWLLMTRCGESYTAFYRNQKDGMGKMTAFFRSDLLDHSHGSLGEIYRQTMETVKEHFNRIDIPLDFVRTFSYKSICWINQMDKIEF